MTTSVQSQTLTDGSTVFNVVRNGEEIAAPASAQEAQDISTAHNEWLEMCAVTAEKLMAFKWTMEQEEVYAAIDQVEKLRLRGSEVTTAREIIESAAKLQSEYDFSRVTTWVLEWITYHKKCGGLISV